VGWVGVIDPDVCAAWGIEGRVGWLELELPAFAAAVRADERVRPVSRFPSSDVDLAFAVPDDTPAASVEATLRAAAGPLLEWVRLFDVYRGPGVPDGARSLAFRLRLVSLGHTLSEAELASVREACIDAVQSGLPATLRG
jgi:phenylalanyl-tRNA synthetase beta chain